MIRAGDMGAVSKLIRRLGREVQGLIKSGLEISYYSRGGWPYNQVMRMSAAERELALDFVNERLKIASKSPFPVY